MASVQLVRKCRPGGPDDTRRVGEVPAPTGVLVIAQDILWSNVARKSCASKMVSFVFLRILHEHKKEELVHTWFSQHRIASLKCYLKFLSRS